MTLYLFWTTIGLIAYSLFGYGLIVRLAARCLPQTSVTVKSIPDELPKVTIIVIAYNEAGIIDARLKNLFSQDYPPEKLEIIVASDGSTDDTVAIASNWNNKVKVLDFQENRGRSITHNDSVMEAKGSIVIFTDADTTFDGNFIQRIVEPFSDEHVGCTVGQLIYRTDGAAASEAEGFYWRFEKRTREAESQLGILATGTGACMAVRKDLWKSLPPTGDCDFTTPLDVVLQGRKIAYVAEAIAYDSPPVTMMGELKTRMRQTSRNLAGTIVRWGWKGYISQPVIGWSLLSHKILRWFTPFFIIMALICNMLLWPVSWIYRFSLAGFIALAILAGIGFGSGKVISKLRIPQILAGFATANAGMAFGVVKALLGQQPKSYGKQK